MRRQFYSILIFCVVVSGLVLLSQTWFLFFGYPSASDFEANQDRYDAVIEYVSKIDIPSSKPAFFTCDSDWTTASIKPRGATTESYRISARRLGDGRLVVTLVTKDMGHAGVFGYLYCSGELHSPEEIGPDPYSGEKNTIHVAADGTWWVERSLSGNWWVVSNELR